MTDSSGIEPVAAVESAPNRQSAPAARTTIEQRLLARISVEVGPERYARYFDRSARLRVHEGRVDVAADSTFAVRYLERRFADSIRRAARHELGLAEPDAVQLSFRVEEPAAGAKPTAPAPRPSGRDPVRKADTRRGARRPIRQRLEEFVVGETNRLAFAAAVRICEDHAGGQGSPLFIHGVCGVGKTHLLQGVAARFQERHPGASARYTTSETFTNAYVHAVRKGDLGAFRNRFRSVDLLCIDDVHFFAGKKSTQSELLHTFDAINLDGSRVVLASDGHPGQIEQLSEALRSRFLAGMVVRLDLPEPELLVKLVRTIAIRRNLLLDEASVTLIAERAGSTGSVRELEGLLTRVDACNRMLGDGAGRVTASTVQMALNAGGPARPRTPIRPVRMGDIVKEVCRTLSVERDDVFGRGRHRKVVLARALCGRLARRLTTLSYPEIARGIGRPNHSSVITACNRIAGQIERGERVVVGHGEVELAALTDQIADRLSEAAARA